METCPLAQGLGVWVGKRGRSGALPQLAPGAPPSHSPPWCSGSGRVSPAALGPLGSTTSLGLARAPPAWEAARAGASPRVQSGDQPAAPNAVSIGARLH